MNSSNLLSNFKDITNFITKKNYKPIYQPLNTTKYNQKFEILGLKGRSKGVLCNACSKKLKGVSCV